MSDLENCYNYPRSFAVVRIKVNSITRTDKIREITDDNKKKKSGPKIDPWGTPDATLDH